MVIDSFTFFMLRGIGFGVMFFVGSWVLLPKAVSYYLQWKNTGKSNFLGAASVCFVMAIFFLSADFVMFVSTFMKRI